MVHCVENQLGQPKVGRHVDLMSKAEIEPPVGQERINLCILRMPIGDKLVLMCEVTARRVRDRYYDAISSRAHSNASVSEFQFVSHVAHRLPHPM